MSLENMYTTSSSARALLNSRLFLINFVRGFLSYFSLLLPHKLAIAFQTHFLHLFEVDQTLPLNLSVLADLKTLGSNTRVPPACRSKQPCRRSSDKD